MKRRSPLKVVLGVTGSIAAYKACELLRLLVQGGFEVRCVLSAGGSRFITPLTLAALSKNPVSQELHDPALWRMAHLELSDWADVIVAAPASADTLARLAGGRASRLLDSLILSSSRPVILCPAMDDRMFRHPATQQNLKTLQGWGYQVWGPVKGPLASGKTGEGRFLEPAEIFEKLCDLKLKPSGRKKQS